MKIVIAAVLGFATLLGGGFYATKNKSSPQVTETISLPSSKSTGSLVTLPTANTGSLVNPPEANTGSLNEEPSNSASKTIVKQSVNKTRVLYLNGEVTAGTVQSLIRSIKELNEKSSEDIYLLLDSPGGSVLDGAQLNSEIEASKAHINTVCTRLCASMAAMIHGHGYKRYALDRAILMYHPATAGVQGQIKNMKSSLTTIDRYIEKMVSHIISRSKVPAAQFQMEVAYELWVDAEDATERGLNDAIVNLNVPSQPASAVTLEEVPPEEQKKNRPSFDIQWISPHPEYWNY
jgi:ATP-dependent Clp protease protease subunit